ncbi:putative RNA recognition motif domain, nucleotide-binding alpha-beta plait domain superfamily [Dioscorea sansibarensis]
MQQQQQQQRLKQQQQALMQQALLQQQQQISLYQHTALLAAHPQIEPMPSGNVPPGFDTSTCRSVYVGNIHTNVSEALLQEVFQSTGVVEGCKLIRKEKVCFHHDLALPSVSTGSIFIIIVVDFYCYLGVSDSLSVTFWVSTSNLLQYSYFGYSNCYLFEVNNSIC